MLYGGGNVGVSVSGKCNGKRWHEQRMTFKNHVTEKAAKAHTSSRCWLFL